MTVSGTVLAREINGTTRHVPKADLSFRVSVYGVAIRGDSVLLVPQWDGFDIPGGGVELGETTPDALRREVQEETGLVVEPTMDQVLHVTHDFFIHPTNGKSYHYILLYYPCSVVGGRLSTGGFQDDEKQYAKMARWVPVSAVRSIKFYNPVDSASIIDRAHRLASGAR